MTEECAAVADSYDGFAETAQNEIANAIRALKRTHATGESNK